MKCYECYFMITRKITIDPPLFINAIFDFIKVTGSKINIAGVTLTFQHVMFGFMKT